MAKNIAIICYNTIEYWNKRENALRFYKDAERNTEGSERERYMNIVDDLEDGKALCEDGASQSIEFLRELERNLNVGTPDGTRDYGNKIHYPIK